VKERVALYIRGYHVATVYPVKHVVVFNGERKYFFSRYNSQWTMHPNTWEEISRFVEACEGLPEWSIEYMIPSEQKTYVVPYTIARKKGHIADRPSGARFVIPVGAAAVYSSDGTLIKKGKTYESVRKQTQHNSGARNTELADPAIQVTFTESGDLHETLRH
jgi:hypothetical protein